MSFCFQRLMIELCLVFSEYNSRSKQFFSYVLLASHSKHHFSYSQLMSAIPLLHPLSQIFAFPVGATLGLPRISNGIHHGYPVTFELSMVPSNFACLFCKNDCTPSVLSLSQRISLNHSSNPPPFAQEGRGGQHTATQTIRK